MLTITVVATDPMTKRQKVLITHQTPIEDPRIMINLDTCGLAVPHSFGNTLNAFSYQGKFYTVGETLHIEEENG